MRTIWPGSEMGGSVGAGSRETFPVPPGSCGGCSVLPSGVDKGTAMAFNRFPPGSASASGGDPAVRLKLAVWLGVS